MTLYRSIARLLRFLLGVFFRRIVIVGDEQVPAEGDGAAIFAGNHTNSLIDPAIIIAFAGRIVHFAARDGLFQSPILRPVLTALGAVPIARRMDRKDGKVDNASAFDKLFDILATGRAIGIFPEGISHDLSQLQPLKTGAARIAFGVAQRNPDCPVRIVPTGLNYGRPKRFRSSVLVQFGEPITIDADWVARFEADERATVRELTDMIDMRLRALTVNAEDWQTIRVLDAVRRIYQPRGIGLEARVELSRRFTAAYGELADQPAIAALFEKVSAYQERLHTIGLRDSDLLRDFSFWQILARFYFNVLRIVFWMPLAIPGFVLHAPLAIIVGLFGVRLSPRKDVIGTSKLVAGIVLAFVSWALLALGVGLAFGPLYGALAALLVPLSGYATLRVLERYVSARSLAISWLRFARFRQEVADLRRERRDLERVVIETVQQFLPDDMEPLFLEAGLERIGRNTDSSPQVAVSS